MRAPLASCEPHQPDSKSRIGPFASFIPRYGYGGAGKSAGRCLCRSAGGWLPRDLPALGDRLCPFAAGAWERDPPRPQRTRTAPGAHGTLLVRLPLAEALFIEHGYDLYSLKKQCPI